MLLLQIGVADKVNAAAGVEVFPPASRRFAILVGVDSYENQNISPLSDPSNDVSALQKVLISNGGFPKENIVVLSTKAGDRSQGGNPRDLPTKTRVLIALSSLKHRLTDDSLLLFMFSGHGIAKQGRAFLLTQDAVLTDDVKLLEDTSLSVDLVTERIADTGAKQAIVLMDACRNDPETDKSLADNNLSPPFTGGFNFSKVNAGVEASAVVFATGLSYRAYVDSEQQLAYFTETLVEALNGRAADKKGDITLGSVLRYVQTEVPSRVRDAMPGKTQKPMYNLAGYLPESLVIAHTTTPVRIVTEMAPVAPLGEDQHGVAMQSLPLQSADLNYQVLYRDTSNELELSKLGDAAFVRGNYDWAIRFLERARSVQKSKVWMQRYPQLATSYLLGENNEDKFRRTLAEMTDQMTIPHTYLNNPVTIGFALDELNSVRKLLPEGYRAVLDDATRRATSIQASLRNQNLVQRGHARLSDCWLDGEHCGFQFAVGKVVPIYPSDSSVTTADVVLMNQTDQSKSPAKNLAMLFAPNDAPPYAGGGDVGAKAGIAELATAQIDGASQVVGDYKPHWNLVQPAHAYSIRTRDGIHAARIKVTSLTTKSIEFDWVYEPQFSK